MMFRPIFLGYAFLAVTLCGAPVLRAETPEEITQKRLQQIMTALRVYLIDVGSYPTEAEGLRALMVAPQGVRDWQGPYLKALPRDGWGRSYQYVCCPEGSADPAPFSMGPDGKAGTHDDIVSW